MPLLLFPPGGYPTGGSLRAQFNRHIDYSNFEISYYGWLLEEEKVNSEVVSLTFE